jgi:50S ribosomal subunit-associated GTPase HflX
MDRFIIWGVEIAHSGTWHCTCGRRRSVRGGKSARGSPGIALVGYTNAGKSTLMSALAGKRRVGRE